MTVKISNMKYLPFAPFFSFFFSCRLYVGTWNVGGVLPSDDLNLEDWLDINNDYYDIYVLG